jgi:hypothetical protein
MQRACGPSLQTGSAPQDLGTPILSLNFERRADIPASMRREIKKHGWEVAGPAAYPRVFRRMINHDSRLIDRATLSHSL